MGRWAEGVRCWLGWLERLLFLRRGRVRGIGFFFCFIKSSESWSSIGNFGFTFVRVDLFGFHIVYID